MTEQAKQELRELIQGGVTLTAEFKGIGAATGSLQTPGLSDKEMTVALVALANTEGGFLHGHIS